jgi:hypothetical protein
MSDNFADASDESQQLLHGHLQDDIMTGVSSIRSDQSMIDFATPDSGFSGISSQDHHQTPATNVQSPVPVAIPSDLKSPIDEMMGRYKDDLNRHVVTWTFGETPEFTSAFVDPVSRECFLSGELVNGEVVVKNQLNWFGTEEESKNGAVARAFDCFEHRGSSPRHYGRRVKEPPYVIGEGPPLPQSIPPECKKQIGHLCQPLQNQATSSVASGMSSLTPDKSRSTKPAPSPRARSKDENPKSKLHERYQDGDINGRRVDNIIPKKNFVAWAFGQSHVPRFSAAFVCPLSGEIFLSGELIISDDEPSEEDDLWWYGKKQKSVEAAAARAFDCFAYREEMARDGISEEIQFCIAPPYAEGEQLKLSDLSKYLPVEYWNKIQKLQETAAWPLPR